MYHLSSKLKKGYFDERLQTKSSFQGWNSTKHEFVTIRANLFIQISSPANMLKQCVPAWVKIDTICKDDFEYFFPIGLKIQFDSAQKNSAI